MSYLRVLPFCLAVLCVSGYAFALMQSDAPTLEKPGEVAKASLRVNCIGFEDEKAEAQAKQIAALAWTTAVQLLGDPARLVTEPPRLFLYSKNQAYQVAEQARTKGRFRDNFAFSHRDDMSSHVVVEPFWSPIRRERLGLPAQAVRLIAHEIAHLAVYSHCPDRAKHHPDWIAEGFAQWVEVQVLLALGYMDKRADSPWDAQVHRQLREMATGDGLPKLEAIFEGDLNSLSFYDLYAVQSGTFQMLMELYPEQTRGFLKGLPKIKDAGLGAEVFRSALEESIGKVLWRTLDVEFPAWAKKLRPQWREPFRSASWHPDFPGVLVQASLGRKNAVLIREMPRTEDAWSLEVTVEILECLPNEDPGVVPQVNLLLDDQEEGFLTVVLHSSGLAGLMEYKSATQEWSRLHAVEASIPMGKPIQIQIDYKDNTLSVGLDGKEAFRLAHERKWDGPWGLGAQLGTVCLWSDLPAGIVSPKTR